MRYFRKEAKGYITLQPQVESVKAKKNLPLALISNKNNNWLITKIKTQRSYYVIFIYINNIKSIIYNR